MADNLITRFVNVCQYLQDPHHVARFQEICGVRETFSGNSDVKSEVERERLLNNGSCTNHQHRAGTENCKVNRSGEGDQTESLRQRTNNLAECNLKRDENNSSPLNSADGSQGFGEIEESKAKVTCSNFTGVREDGVERRETPSMYSSTSNGSTPAEMTVDALGNNTFLGGTTVKPLRKNSLTGEAGQAFLIENKFLYYLFTFGTELGNEPFYITFFPFIMWNVDAYVSRRLILVWVWVMYIGQCTKDVIRRSRPASPPVIKVEMFYNSEYSLPSTHAMSGTAIPLSLLFLTYGRWEYPLLLGVTIAMSWSVLVCVSRIYMGMHSILDIIVGFLYSLLILLVFGPVFERMDTFNQSHPYAPLLIVPLHLAMGLLSFTLDAWSTSRADTAQILGTGAGAALATCLNGRLGMPLDLPASALPLRAPGLGRVLAPAARALLRFGVGSLLLLATRAVMKALTIPLACRLAGVPSTDIRKARQHTAVELPYRYLVYGTVGFSALFIVPYLFYFVGLF